MNKELIKKYKKEFDHWLNGGELLSKHPDESNWYLVTTVLWNCPKMQYVIDDKYVEFRKALAEGKVVQKQDYYTKEWIDMKSDNFHSASDTQYEGVYRIKPEEPKFKVGDWVLHKSKGVCKIEKISPSNEPDDKNVWLYNKGACFINELELWEPKPGEWCIMYDTDENPNASSVTLQKWDGKNKWKPIPFIGQLPPYIKASNES